MSRAPTVYSMLSPGTHLAQYAFAVMHSQLGDNEEAFAALNAALDERGGMDVFAGVDPALDPLRHDPRFEAVLARLHIPAATV